MRDSTFEHLARLGYAARGSVYVIVGGLAVLAALGSGGAATDGKGALLTLLSQPFGSILLGAVALGLICFAAWRFAQAFLDADHLGTGGKALLRRIGFGGGAFAAVALAATAIGLLSGFAVGGTDGESSAKDWTALLISMPFGRWLVAAIGVLAIGAAAAVAFRGFTGEFKERLVLSKFSSGAFWIVLMGHIGFLARAAVFMVVGLFLILAALHGDASEARGLAGALRALQAKTYGLWVFSMVAFGLFAFGLFQFIVAACRRIDVSELRGGDNAPYGRARHAVSS